MADEKDDKKPGDEGKYGAAIPPDDEYAGWDWKQIAAAIIGGIDMSLSRQHDLQAEFSEPTSLTYAGHVFFALADQINYALVTFNYNINALLGDDGKGPWNGNAAKVAAANFTYFSTAVQKQLDAITGNGEPTRAIYNQLYNSGNYLNWAVHSIHEIDEFFSTWAAAHGAKVTPAEDGTNIVHVSDIKGLPEVIQKTMLPVIKQLANTYYVTHKEATLPPYSPPVLPPPKQPDNNSNIPNLDLSHLGDGNKGLPDALNNLGNKFGDGLNHIGDNFGDGLNKFGKNLGDGLGGLNNLKNLNGLNGLDNLKNLNGLNGLNNLRIPPPPDGPKNLAGLPGGPDGPGRVPPLALPSLGGPNGLGGPNRLSTIDGLGAPRKPGDLMRLQPPNGAPPGSVPGLTGPGGLGGLPGFHLSAPGRFRATDLPSGGTGGRLGGGFDESGRPLDRFGRPILGGAGGGPGGGPFDRFGRPILGGPGGGPGGGLSGGP